LAFEPPHSEWGREFATKSFAFDDNKPGVLNWGTQGKSFLIEMIIE